MVAMALAKLEIRVEGQTDPIKALFNPNQIIIQKTVNWRTQPRTESDTQETQFTSGNPATLTLDLFFDTYEKRADIEAGSDVTKLTEKVVALTTVEEHGDLHRPPICTLSWGQFGSFFQGVLESLTQRYTLFLSNGTPVRATLSCSFKQWRSKDEEKRLLRLSSVDVAKTRTVRRGDSLASIADEEYLDPTLWRPIAEANGIDDPRSVVPGMGLSIPPLPPDGMARS
jgi:nucleoid-associated protein YgaU